MSSEGGLGNVGEPPVSLFQTRNGGPGDQKPVVSWGFRPGHEPYGDTTNTRKQARYRGGERQAKPPETGRAAVVAEHSTEEGGEVRPKRPTGGKAPSSRASAGGT